jgi:hypothetical protein
MRALVATSLLICVFVCSCPMHAGALDCAVTGSWDFDRIDGDDPQKRQQDAEARAALANLGQVVFRGRFAWARNLSGPRNNISIPVLLIVFEDVEVLQGMARSSRDRKLFLLYYADCGSGCTPVSKWWPRGPNTFSANLFNGEPIRDVGSEKVIYKGRVDVVADACRPILLTPLQTQLLTGPKDEIDRLIREYPWHPRRELPAGSG